MAYLTLWLDIRAKDDSVRSSELARGGEDKDETLYQMGVSFL